MDEPGSGHGGAAIRSTGNAPLLEATSDAWGHRGHGRGGGSAVPVPRRRFRPLRALAGFVAGLILGWCCIFFGWAALATPNNTSSGGDAMAVAFFIAPVGAVLLGILAAGVAGRPRRQRSDPGPLRSDRHTEQSR